MPSRTPFEYGMEMADVTTTTAVDHYKMFIDGELVDGADQYELISPSSGERWAPVPKAHLEHVDRAFAAAKRVHDAGEWRALTPTARAAFLLAAADRIE